MDIASVRDRLSYDECSVKLCVSGPPGRYAAAAVANQLRESSANCQTIGCDAPSAVALLCSPRARGRARSQQRRDGALSSRVVEDQLVVICGPSARLWRVVPAASGTFWALMTRAGTRRSSRLFLALSTHLPMSLQHHHPHTLS